MPLGEAAAQALDVGKALLDQLQRHTGARVLARSGAVGDDGLLGGLEPRDLGVELRRVDQHGSEFHASFVVEIAALGSLQALLDGVQKVMPGANVSVVERDGLD